MLTVYLTLIVGGAAESKPLPLVRATLLRESGSWLRWEGDVAIANGAAAFQIPEHVDAPTISVERREKDDWRVADYTIAPRTPPGRASPPPASSERMLTVTVPAADGETTVRIRCQALSLSTFWRASYLLDLREAGSKLTMRAAVQSPHGTSNDAAVEVIASTGRPRTTGEDRWADSTTYELSAKRIAQGTTSLALFDEQVDAEEIVAVELGALAGEPALKIERDRATIRLRIANRTKKSWPAGELLIARDGRLVARTTMPHADAGQAVEVSLGAAVGVSVVRDEVEIERKTATMRRETDPPDSIQTAGSATIVNRTGKAIHVRATKTVAGDATAASDEAKIVRTSNRLGIDQPLNEIRWNFTLPANGSKRLTFGTLIRIQQPLESKDRP
jgi:hypothetical protein